MNKLTEKLVTLKKYAVGNTLYSRMLKGRQPAIKYPLNPRAGYAPGNALSSVQAVFQRIIIGGFTVATSKKCPNTHKSSNGLNVLGSDMVGWVIFSYALSVTNLVTFDRVRLR